MPFIRPTRLVVMLMVTTSITPLLQAQDEKAILENYRQAAMTAGQAAAGKIVFASKQAACAKCHALAGQKPLAGPNLSVIGDKYARDQLIQSVLEPSAQL
ncbi:MAG: c-type cytochrome, partial [Planctomycetaceae bacterium]|nr:c-type cytochrome [Planctomycetaceae bacterium]